MKLMKLSLAAAVAAGALTSSAFAVSFEDAIKGVDFSGYARYRYDSGTLDKVGTTAKHRFTTEGDFKVKFDDNFYGVLGFMYDSFDTSGDHVDGGVSNTGAWSNNQAEEKSLGNTGFDIRRYYAGYKVGGTDITFGRQTLGTFFTDDMVGTGIKLVNTDVAGLTFAALAMDNLEKDSDFKLRDVIINKEGTTVSQNNLYGAAVIGSFNPIDFQIWGARLDKVLNWAVVGEVAGNFALGGDAALGFKLQASANKANDKDWFMAGLGDSKYYGAELSAKFSGVALRAGYVNFSTDKGKVGAVALEDSGKFLRAGQNLLTGYKAMTGYNGFYGKNQYFYVTAAYKFLGKFGVGAEYVRGTIDDGVKETAQEIVGRLSYQHSKKLSFSGFWSNMKIDDAKRNDFRLQAQYNF